MELKNLTGIETDIQLSADGYIMIMHDETLDRTTDGKGELRNYTLEELKNMKIDAGDGRVERIPTVEELLDLLEPRLLAGTLKLNLELKNSNIRYVGMEQKIVELIHKRGLEKAIVYSSFYGKSLNLIRELDSEAEIGILDRYSSDCLFKIKGGVNANAIHPDFRSIDSSLDELKGYTVRAWGGGLLFPEKPSGKKLDLTALEAKGITDMILNEPEAYVS
jgi:glycerophosphoryl diester phosphodiesterase